MSVVSKQTGFQAVLQKTMTIASNDDAMVIVDRGPVDVYLYSELVSCNNQIPVIIYGAEPWQPYGRVKVSSYLAGDVNRDSLIFDINENGQANIEARINRPVIKINREQKTIEGAEGRMQKYSHLVLAVDSSPFIPLIHNSQLSGGNYFIYE
jgi:nitrite reductase (NADH) large subunit